QHPPLQRSQQALEPARRAHPLPPQDTMLRLVRWPPDSGYGGGRGKTPRSTAPEVVEDGLLPPHSPPDCSNVMVLTWRTAECSLERCRACSTSTSSASGRPPPWPVSSTPSVASL